MACGVTTQYAYDADAWRVKKAITGGATTYAVRGPNGQLLTEWTNTSPTALARDHVYAGTRLLSVVSRHVPPK
jgi:hypothetical protein